MKTYNNRQSCSRQTVDEKLFGDVVATVWVLKRQVKFVIAIQDVKTLVGGCARAFEGAASAINVDLYVLWQLVGELQSIVACGTIRNEPRDLRNVIKIVNQVEMWSRRVSHLFRLVHCVVAVLFDLPNTWIEVLPLLVRCHHVWVASEIQKGEILGFKSNRVAGQ